jgi:hypothetical protein
MKRILFLLLIGIANITCKSQVVFCPVGAEWHYLFGWLGYLPGNSYNETIKYVGDSIDGVDVLKILSHKRFFLQCSPLVTKTVIKQKGDTVFFKNSRTQNTWQILYNFAALPGHTWVTTIMMSNNSSETYTYTVNSVQQNTVNGFNLKSLIVNSVNSANTGTSSLNITERFGCSGFLFNFDDFNPGTCDAEYFQERLCYQDSAFGIKQFSSYPCDYYTTNITGIKENRLNELPISIFPNPTTDKLFLKFDDSIGAFKTTISNLLGQTISEIVFTDIKAEIDLRSFSSGIYYLKAENKIGQKVFKIVKE